MQCVTSHYLLEHDFHRRATELRELLVLIELVRRGKDLAPAEEVRDLVRLLEPSPIPMHAVEPHLIARELRVLGISDRRALRLDLLATGELITDLYPRLLHRSGSTVGRDYCVARRADDHNFDCLHITIVDAYRHKEDSDAHELQLLGML